ncbi:MAG: histidine kinase [Bacteroides sp.]|nr:histidine kinase [Bacteroides sp.]
MQMISRTRNNILYDFLIQPWYRIWRHVLFFLTFTFIFIGQSLFVFGDQLEAIGNKVYWFTGGSVLTMVTVLYLNIYYHVPLLLLKNKYVQFFAIFLAETALYIIIKSVVETHLLAQIGITRNFNGITLLDIISNLTLYTICIIGSSATVLFKQWITDSENIDDLKNKQLKNRVEELKNRINPKFLTNILDYVSEKVKSDSCAASDILFSLSDMLRYELYDCKREKVLLDSDVEFIDAYLSLEQLNHPGTFTHTITTTGKSKLFVPPFTYVPIIRKIIEQHPTSIHITFDIGKHSVTFRCTVSGANLGHCDFSPEKQRLAAIHHKNINLVNTADSVELHHEICWKK